MTIASNSFEKTKPFRFISEYCSSSSLHGVKFIGEPSRPYWERVFWLCVLFLSLYGSTTLTLQVWEKWQNHPVILTYSDKTTPINKIPFPAMTICPTNQIKNSSFDTAWYLEKLSNGNVSLSQEELKTLEVISNFCDGISFVDLIETGISNKDILHIMNRLNPPIEEIFLKCTWRGRVHPCDTLWMKVLTSNGICYTFNSLGSKNMLREEIMIDDNPILDEVNVSVNWDSNNGYLAKNRNEMVYPRRVWNAGFEIGMTLSLIGRQDEIILECGGISPGYLLLVHAPNDYPDGDRNFVRISFGQEVLIAIKPSMIITSSKLRNYLPEKRQCYLSEERHLRFFKIYTQSNCEMECVGNYSLSLCNCLPFYYPRPENVSICKVQHYECFTNATQQMLIAESENDQCKCLPGCTSLSYTMEVSESDIYESDEDVYEKDTSAWDMRADAVIYFKEDHFWMSKRSESYGITEVLANCGGVLGLLIGFSALSLIEIFYFLTFRLFQFTKSKATIAL